MEKINLNIIGKIESLIRAPITDIKKISIGYTNTIYSINEKYILRICSNPNNMTNFARASSFCKTYSKSINCPQIICFYHDEVTQQSWQLEEKFNGVNLSSKWLMLSEYEKEATICKICEELKKIHRIPILSVFEKEFSQADWMNKFIRDIEKKCCKLEYKYSNMRIFNEIRAYMKSQALCLNEVNYAICHTDLHFDNIMIDDSGNIALLDFDRLRISSIDYELDIINVMTAHPDIVINFSYCSNSLVAKDFFTIIPYFKKYYPKLFEFDMLKQRLDIYSLKHYLAALGYAKDKEVIFNIIRSIIQR